MAHPKAGKPKGLPPKHEVLAKEAEVVRLRRAGNTWDAIAQQVGYRDASSAHTAFQRANRRIIQDDIDAIRRLETERLDQAQAAIWGNVITGDIPAINTLIKIMDRRAKLLGLDQPIRQQLEVISYDGNTVRAELERILAQSSNSGTQGILASTPSTSEPATTR